MTGLAPIRRLARSGASERAWTAFVAAGLDRVTDEERVLTLKGRLLKDRAFASVNVDDRLALLHDAARTYCDAATLTGDSYPRINAAALVYLRGDRHTAAMLAANLLALIDSGHHGGETPYWREATRAEALLLLGRTQDAAASLRAAIALAPAAREDRAATLRQFRRILAADGSDADWLAEFALAPVMPFKGPMALGHGEQVAQMMQQVAMLSPGLAFGALAAGSDIVIAEAALSAGAELHVVLPCDAASFRATSVEPYGGDWGMRFDTLIEAATSLECLDEPGGLTAGAVVLAEAMVMGLARTEAEATASQVRGLRSHWRDESLAQGESVLIDLGDRPASVHLALRGPELPQIMLTREGEADASLVAWDQLATLPATLRPGDRIDALVPAEGALPGAPSARLAAMALLNESASVLASRPAALALVGACPSVRASLAGSIDSMAGPVELFDITG